MEKKKEVIEGSKSTIEQSNKFLEQEAYFQDQFESFHERYLMIVEEFRSVVFETSSPPDLKIALNGSSETIWKQKLLNALKVEKEGNLQHLNQVEKEITALVKSIIE
jgi:hypothetical protein